MVFVWYKSCGRQITIKTVTQWTSFLLRGGWTIVYSVGAGSKVDRGHRHVGKWVTPPTLAVSRPPPSGSASPRDRAAQRRAAPTRDHSDVRINHFCCESRYWYTRDSYEWQRQLLIICEHYCKRLWLSFRFIIILPYFTTLIQILYKCNVILEISFASIPLNAYLGNCRCFCIMTIFKG